jgi:hypothetical protein
MFFPLPDNIGRNRAEKGEKNDEGDERVYFNSRNGIHVMFNKLEHDFSFW